MYWWTGVGRGWSGLLGARCWMRGFRLKQHGSVCVRMPPPPPLCVFCPLCPQGPPSTPGSKKIVQRNAISSLRGLFCWGEIH